MDHLNNIDDYNNILKTFTSIRLSISQISSLTDIITFCKIKHKDDLSYSIIITLSFYDLFFYPSMKSWHQIKN